MPAFPVSPAARVVLVFAISAATALGCINGVQFHPPQVFAAQPPKIEPPKLDGFLAANAPFAIPPPDNPATPPVTAEEQHAAFVAFAREFEAKQAKDTGFNDALDYSVALIRLGRHADAIKALTALEAAHPGAYATAANLGTAYELAGQLPEAVIWIARGIERDPQSHQGTEWLHLAILHAKIQLRANANWIAKHSVLEGVPAERSGEDIVRAIDYQLRERLTFVQPKDPVVCDLFYQAALRVGGPDSAARRAHYLRESLRFGDWRKAEIAKLRKT